MTPLKEENKKLLNYIRAIDLIYTNFPRISVSVFFRKSVTRLCNCDEAKNEIFAQ